MKLNAPVRSAAALALTGGSLKVPGSIRNGIAGKPGRVMVATAEVIGASTIPLPTLSMPSIATLMGVAPGEPIPMSVKFAMAPLHGVTLDVQVIVLSVIEAVDPTTLLPRDAVNGDWAMFVTVKLVMVAADVVRAPRNVKPSAVKSRIVQILQVKF